MQPKNRTDATFPAGSTITENPKDENVKQQQPSAGTYKQNGSSEEIPRKPPGGPRPHGAHSSGSSPGFDGLRDEEAGEGFSEMQNLLAKYHVGVQSGQIQHLIEAGRAQGLALDGVLGFVEDKLMQKRDQNDPVFSAKLLINAISNDADLHRWLVKRHSCSAFFDQKSKHIEAPSVLRH